MLQKGLTEKTILLAIQWVREIQPPFDAVAKNSYSEQPALPAVLGVFAGTAARLLWLVFRCDVVCGEVGLVDRAAGAAIFRAVMTSSPTDAGKVLYAVEAQLVDEYDLCEGAGLVLNKRWPRAVWSEVADALRKRLGGLPHPGRPEWSDRGYRRGRLVEWIVELLDQAGRSTEVVPLHESEVAAGGPHERLVKRLIEEKRMDDAASRAEEGIALSPPDHEGTRARLQDLLRQIRRNAHPCLLYSSMNPYLLILPPHSMIASDNASMIKTMSGEGLR